MSNMLLMPGTLGGLCACCWVEVLGTDLPITPLQDHTPSNLPPGHPPSTPPSQVLSRWNQTLMNRAGEHGDAVRAYLKTKVLASHTDP
jgi:hypothetical protein